MASQFQSRLVGTIVFVALGVIVLPDLFDGEKKQHDEQFEAIPLAPEVSHETLVVQAPETIASVETVPAMPAQSVTINVDDAESEPESEMDVPAAIVLESPAQPKADFNQSAWVIQLGVFSNHDNANRLVRKLREQGFDAQVITKGLADSSLNRVVVGPALERRSLENQLGKLENLTGLKGQLLRFDPLAP